MDLDISIGVLITATFLAAFAFYKSRIPTEPGNPWSVPWNGVLFIAILALLLTASHLMAIFKS
ncbi:MAG: hypothetical protein H6912_05890 [Kordiimonadaceae bacterium]|nr:hypothetical protein [Kordiimonadaceae bacterium]